ncbi:hypothetical protein [Halosegnis sp.]|uniref:hypothetical protein n=1 Tax=Halosegnis sp. TaxID=2864959 RepID=UPI0035D50933
MQRRVAAIYFVFFVVLGASAYSVLAVAEQPAVDVPGETYTNGSEFAVGGQEYTVVVEMQESEGGGHGGGGGAEPVGELVYLNESARMTATWDNESTVTYRGEEYRVELNADASRVRLVETFDVPARLQNDSAVYNETTTIEGVEYVTYRENDTNVRLDEYLPKPTTYTFEVGDTIEYDGETTTLESVDTSAATLAWTAPEQQSITLEEGANVTLADGNQYYAHFKTHGELRVTIAPTTTYSDYQGDLARQEYFHERQNGLWGVIILSGIAAFLIISMAYMPVKG